jgi:hypothetical protein
MLAGMLCTAVVERAARQRFATVTAAICNATRREITCTIFFYGDRLDSPRKYSIPVGTCFTSHEVIQALHVGVASPAMQLNLKDEQHDGGRSWVVTEEAGQLQVRLSSGTHHPFYWLISSSTGSYDVQDQATVEAWGYDAATRREGVKHITQLCSEAASTAAASSTHHGPDNDSIDAPTNGADDYDDRISLTSGTSMPSTPLSRLLAVLRHISPSYSASDFAYVPLTIALEELMAAPLPPAQLQEVAKILVGRGLGPKCPALVAAANATNSGT